MIILRRSRYLVATPPPGPFVLAATYLHRSPGWSHARRFSRLNRDVETQLRSSSGALAYSLQRSLTGRDVWTLSLWADRQSMTDFVRSGTHHTAAVWLRSAEENVGKFAQWEIVHPKLDWEEAYDRLGLPRPEGRILDAPTQVPSGWRTAAG